MIVAIDISHWQGEVNYPQVKASGVVAVWAKSSEGSTSYDDTYARAQSECRRVGLKFGAYHFFHGDPAEADNFLRRASLAPDELAALDWENTESGYAPTAAQARGWLERVAQKRGQKPVIYSGNVAKERIQGHDPFFAGHRLWLAQYSRSWSVQQSWTEPWLWQYSEQGHVPGVAGFCDVNTIVSGTVEQFASSWAEGAQPVPAPTPVPGPPPPGPTPSPPSPTYEGLASWYSDDTNADNSPVKATDMTVAVVVGGPLDHFGALLRITNMKNGKVAVGKVTDHGGPALAGRRIIDCRPALAIALGFGPETEEDPGIIPVKVEILHKLGDES